MRHRFIDLGLLPKAVEPDHLRRLLLAAEALGYREVCLGFEAPAQLGEAKSILNKLRSEAGLEVYTRLELRVGTRSEALRILRKYRRRVEIVAADCITLELARLAAHDHRIDLVYFDPLRKEPAFDPAEATMLRKFGTAALEVRYARVLELLRSGQYKAVNKLAAWVRRALDNGVQVIVTSGARDVYELRGARDVIALLRVLGFEADPSMISDLPRDILERNLSKLSPDYVCHGVRVVGREEKAEEALSGVQNYRPRKL